MAAPSSSSARLARAGEQAWSKAKKANSELFALTYGALVMQVIEDFEEVKAVNAQLELMGYNIGIRLIDEFLAKSGVSSCGDLGETAEAIAKVAFKMFLGVTAEVSGWNSDRTAFSLLLSENPLTDFVELPPKYRDLSYSNILCGTIRGALEMIQMRVECTCLRDQLRGDETNEFRIVLKEVMSDEMDEQYREGT